MRGSWLAGRQAGVQACRHAARPRTQSGSKAALNSQAGPNAKRGTARGRSPNIRKVEKFLRTRSPKNRKVENCLHIRSPKNRNV
eukprot:3468678-Heterocapsa_arctica.AAC.1